MYPTYRGPTSTVGPTMLFLVPGTLLLLLYSPDPTYKYQVTIKDLGHRTYASSEYVVGPKYDTNDRAPTW